MGLTPIDGLVMGTRCGDIDPSVVTYLMSKLNVSADEVLNILNKKSGLLGISGVSNDCRLVEGAAAEGNERADLAMKMFVRRVKGYVGNYLAQLNGADALVFTAGIGENDPTVRADICEGLTNLGFKIDPEKNKARETVISADDSPIKILLIPTNEELVIARDTQESFPKRNRFREIGFASKYRDSLQKLVKLPGYFEKKVDNSGRSIYNFTVSLKGKRCSNGSPKEENFEI